MRKLTFLSCILFVLAVFQPVNGATITLTTDTNAELTGSFSFTGSDSGFVNVLQFLHLPDDTNVLFGGRNPELASTFSVSAITAIPVQVSFGSSAEGSPDNPYFNLYTFSPGALPEVVGNFDNNVGNIPVSFRFYDIQDTGGLDGTFSGKFQFNLVTNTPDGGSTLVLFGLALMVVAFARRRKS